MTKQEIFDRIASYPDCRVVNSTEIQTRCFLCGDSKKNLNKKRLYIHIDTTNPTEPILYNCFNCMQCGILTADMLANFDISDIDTTSYVRRLNHQATKDDGSIVNRYRNKHEIKVIIPPITKKPTSLNKLKYLYDRIGYRIPIKDFERLKIIWSIEDFLSVNNIKPINQFTWLYERDYVGFLSVKNEYIILRDITNMNKMRYVKYNIFDMRDNTESFYVPQVYDLDILTQDKITVNIAEGPIDILSIIYNIYDGNFDNNIFLASCNGSFLNPIKFIVRKGIVGKYREYNIWQDNDTRLNMKDIVKYLRLFTPNVHVYFNQLSKDFGVTLNQIDVGEIRV